MLISFFLSLSLSLCVVSHVLDLDQLRATSTMTMWSVFVHPSRTPFPTRAHTHSERETMVKRHFCVPYSSLGFLFSSLIESSRHRPAQSRSNERTRWSSNVRHVLSLYWLHHHQHREKERRRPVHMNSSGFLSILDLTVHLIYIK